MIHMSCYAIAHALIVCAGREFTPVAAEAVYIVVGSNRGLSVIRSRIMFGYLKYQPPGLQEDRRCRQVQRAKRIDRGIEELGRDEGKVR